MLSSLSLSLSSCLGSLALFLLLLFSFDGILKFLLFLLFFLQLLLGFGLVLRKLLSKLLLLLPDLVEVERYVAFLADYLSVFLCPYACSFRTA